MENENNKLFGLLGRNIDYSFSRGHFAKKFQKENLAYCKYVNFDISTIEGFSSIIKDNKDLIGLNVTIPYKEEVIPLLNELSDNAKAIGAVNTITVSPEGKTVGYNTDYYGFQKSLQPLLENKHTKALILGTGGAAKGVAYALKELNIEFTYVSRTASDTKIAYSDLNESFVKEHLVIINCSPIGTSPNTDQCPNIPYQFVTEDHIAYDLIYNPEETLFLQKCKNQGAATKNGSDMLVLQAEKSWEIWNKRSNFSNLINEQQPKTILEMEQEITSAEENKVQNTNETVVVEAPIDNVQKEGTMDYSNLSLEELTNIINQFVTEDEIVANRSAIEEIKKAFYNSFNSQLPDISVDDEAAVILKDKLYQSKSVFEKKYFECKETQKKHQKNVESNLKKNLQERLDIIEDLKNLVSPENTETNKFNAFKVINERWKNAGSCPKDKYNHVWNNYHFHVENFFDYIHLDKDARDLEFKNNYAKKIELLARLEELVVDQDIRKALNEIKLIQKVWREDVGPVERTKRQELWDAFDAINAKVAERRKDLKALLAEEEKQNLILKNALIEKIKELTLDTKNSIDFWNNQNKQLGEFKNAFMSIGRTPKADSDITWTNFRAALKDFNSQKNNYFKELREEQNINIEKKKVLIKKAQELENSDDWANTTDKIKQVQRDWKKIGHVPSRFSNPLWKEFKASCDNYFNRYHKQKDTENAQELENFTKKEAFLLTIDKTKLVGTPEEDLKIIQVVVNDWNELGRVPFSKKKIQDDFNKAIDALYNKIKLEPAALDLLKFRSTIERLVASGDTRKLEDEERFVSKKINDERNEVNQLENNISFFSSGKKENPFLKEVEKNILKHQENLEGWKTKLGVLRNLK